MIEEKKELHRGMKKKRRDANTTILTRDNFIRRLAKASGLTKTQIRKLLLCMEEIIVDAVAEGYRVNIIRGISVYALRLTGKGATYYDINTGTFKPRTHIMYPYVLFSKTFKDKILKVYKDQYEKKEDKEND